MSHNPTEVENAYPEHEIFSTFALLAKEFVALGCEVSRVGGLLVVTREGKLCYLKETETSFTSLVSFRILKDKQLANNIFRSLGMNVAEMWSFLKSEKSDALRLVTRLGPSVLKPVDGRKGKGVSIGVTASTFDTAWAEAWSQTNRNVIVEPFFANGKEARYLVVDGSCVAVLMRVPPAVKGDGIHSVEELVALKNRARASNPHLRRSPIRIDSHRQNMLHSQGFELGSIPEAGQWVTIDWKGGISSGADSRDITAEVHPSMKQVAERVAHALPGLDVVGVDILAYNHSSPVGDGSYMVIEANTRPGIGGHHYPAFGHPINVCRLIAESCLRRMGFDVSDGSEERGLKSGE